MPVELYWSSHEEGITELEAFFEYAGYKARDMREPLGRSADYITATVEGQFISEGGRSGEPWAPLTEEYHRWKEAHGGGMLLDLEVEFLHGEPGTPRDEKMRDALVDPAAWRITMTEAEWLPDSTRAAWHQTGAERSRGGILPARPPLDLNEGDYEMIEEIFIDWLDELRGANAARSGPAALPTIFR